MTLGLMIRKHFYLTPGQVALARNGKIVWAGRLGEPFEDVDCDTVLVSEADYEDIKRQTPSNGEGRKSDG